MGEYIQQLDHARKCIVDEEERVGELEVEVEDITAERNDALTDTLSKRIKEEGG